MDYSNINGTNQDTRKSTGFNQSQIPKDGIAYDFDGEKNKNAIQNESIKGVPAEIQNSNNYEQFNTPDHQISGNHAQPQQQQSQGFSGYQNAPQPQPVQAAPPQQQPAPKVNQNESLSQYLHKVSNNQPQTTQQQAPRVIRQAP